VLKESIMKIIIFFASLSITLGSTVQAEPIQISLHDALKGGSVEQNISKVLPGEKSFASLTSAAITLNGSEKIPGHVEFKLHLKGSKYLIPYNFRLNTNTSFNIGPNCKITHLDIQSNSNFGYGYDTAFFHIYWYFFEKSVEEQVIRTITEEVNSINDPQIKMLCGHG